MTRPLHSEADSAYNLNLHSHLPTEVATSSQDDQKNYALNEHLKTATRQPSARASQKLSVELPYIPPPYVPGTGPPSVDATLLPPHDSTAYIISRLFLPEGLASDGKPRPKSLAWLIGFTDRPAARIAVRAHKVYDYVSPRELEDYEYRQWLRREEEKELTARGVFEEAMASKKQAAGAAMEKKTSKPAPGKPDKKWRDVPEVPTAGNATKETTIWKKKRKPGPGGGDIRIPEVETPSEATDQLTVIPWTIPPIVTSGLSLPTPKKRKLQMVDLVATGSEASDYDDMLIQEQTMSEESQAQCVYGRPSPSKRIATSAHVRYKSPGRKLFPEVHKKLGSLTTLQRPQLVPEAGSKSSHSVPPLARNSKSYSQSQHQGSHSSASTEKEDDEDTVVVRSGPSIKPAAPIKARQSSWASINGSSLKRAAAIQSRVPLVLEEEEEEEEEEEDDDEEELGEDEYIVENIEGMKIHRNRLMFYVHWKGDWPPSQQRTWEPFENVNDVMINAYLVDHPEEAAALDAHGRIERFRKREAARERKAARQDQPTLGTVMSTFEGEAQWLDKNPPLDDLRDRDDDLESDVLVVTEEGTEKGRRPKD